MAIEKNWLLLTNYTGVLQIVPLGNRPFFEAQNKTVKKYQYKFREMTYQDAVDFVEKHNGRDPDFMTPARTASILSDKDRQIEDLKAQLAALQGPHDGMITASPMKVPEGLKGAPQAPENTPVMNIPESNQVTARGPGRPRQTPAMEPANS
jgi:hypothetical protein